MATLTYDQQAALHSARQLQAADIETASARCNEKFASMPDQAFARYYEELDVIAERFKRRLIAAGIDPDSV